MPHNARRPSAITRVMPVPSLVDRSVLGALRAAQNAGLNVPQDMSIMGMDDIFAAATTFPPLTTIAKPKYEIGATAARFLLERIAGKAPAAKRHPLLACRLELRESTAPPA